MRLSGIALKNYVIDEQEETPLLNKKTDTVTYSIDSWRRKATNVYSLFMMVATLPVLISVYFLDVTTLQQSLLGLSAWLLTFCAAALRRLDVRYRIMLMVISVWILTSLILTHGGMFLNFRLPLINLPMMVLMLGGARFGLAVGAINLLIMLLAVWGTQTGLLPQVAPEWNDTIAKMQYLTAFTLFVPHLLLLAWFSHHLTSAIRREHLATARLQKEAQQRMRLEVEVVETGERVSRHIGSELHDGVCQDLTGLLLRTKRAQKTLTANNRPEADTLNGIVEGLGDAIGEIHGLSQTLSPGFLTCRDLADAIEVVAQRFGEASDASIEFRVQGDGPVQNEQATLHLYRIAQEAIANAIRHSGAKRIEVSLIYKPDMTVLLVDDDGQWIVPNEKAQDGLGQKTIRWRASVIGGTLTVGSKARGGSRVECRVPIEQKDVEVKHD